MRGPHILERDLLRSEAPREFTALWGVVGILGWFVVIWMFLAAFSPRL